MLRVAAGGLESGARGGPVCVCECVRVRVREAAGPRRAEERGQDGLDR